MVLEHTPGGGTLNHKPCFYDGVVCRLAGIACTSFEAHMQLCRASPFVLLLSAMLSWRSRLGMAATISAQAPSARRSFSGMAAGPEVMWLVEGIGTLDGRMEHSAPQ